MSSPANVLTSEKRLDLRKKATNFSDWPDTRLSRMNLAKIMTQLTNENRSRIARTTRSAMPASLKKEKIEGWPGRFSEVTG